MAGEPVDRRGLLRDLFRQATNAVAPAFAGSLGPFAKEPGRPPRAVGRTATVEELLHAAAEHGLGERGEAVERLARHSLRLAPAAHAGTGALGFGGQPLLGEGQEWPSWRGRGLTFLAQVEAGDPLGRLAFFYDTVGRPSGCLAAHRGSARVLRANDPRLVPAEGPALPAGPVPGLLALELVLPAAGSDTVQALDLSERERASWEALREELAGMQGTELAERPGAFRVVHRLFGYPDGADREMALTCELAMAGEDVIEGRARLHPLAAGLERRAERWELVGQFSGDGKLDWPWVAQRVYFWADRDALAAGDLEQVWAIAR